MMRVITEDHKNVLVWCEALSIKEMKAALVRQYPNGPFTFTDFCNYPWLIEKIWRGDWL